MVNLGITGCQSGTSQVQMPNFNEQLDDRSIRAALAFVENRWPASLRGAQNTFNDSESDTAEMQEAVLYTAICQSPSPCATGR